MGMVERPFPGSADSAEQGESERERRDRIHREGVARNLEDAEPVVHALRDAGFVVNTITELPVGYPGFEEAVPILMEWLPRVTNVDIKMAIIRKLCGKWAKAAGPLLVEEFRRAGQSSPSPLGWLLGDALGTVADRKLYPEVLQLVEDDRYGDDRQMLIYSLGRIGGAAAVPTLIRLLGDKDVRGHAINALGRLKAREARSAIEPFLQDSNSWIRREAKKALARIDTAAQRSSSEA
jgi:hypothetical protein